MIKYRPKDEKKHKKSPAFYIIADLYHLESNLNEEARRTAQKL